jgi:hypothetical protein
VAPEHDPALEAEEQVLPDRLDAFEHASVEDTGNSRGLPSWMRALDVQTLSHERLQSLGGSMQRVSLGHPTSVPETPNRLAGSAPERDDVRGLRDCQDSRIGG